jgi:hypothetical protein
MKTKSNECGVWAKTYKDLNINQKINIKSFQIAVNKFWFVKFWRMALVAEQNVFMAKETLDTRDFFSGRH